MDSITDANGIIHHYKRSANGIADALAKLNFLVVITTVFGVPPPPIHDEDHQEEKKADKYTRSFYFHVSPSSDTSRTTIQISDDSR